MHSIHGSSTTPVAFNANSCDSPPTRGRDGCFFGLVGGGGVVLPTTNSVELMDTSQILVLSLLGLLALLSPLPMPILQEPFMLNVM